MKGAKQQPESQASRFREAAKELGADMSEADFNEALRRVGKAPQPKDDGAKKDKKR